MIRSHENPVLEAAREYRSERLRMANPKGWRYIHERAWGGWITGSLFVEADRSEVREGMYVLGRLAGLADRVEREQRAELEQSRFEQNFSEELYKMRLHVPGELFEFRGTGHTTFGLSTRGIKAVVEAYKRASKK